MFGFIRGLFHTDNRKPEAEESSVNSQEVIDKDPYEVCLNVDLDNNQLGETGEDFFCWLFRLCGVRINFLGAKAPDVDCFMYFVDSGKTYEFLVQVKTTGEIVERQKTVSSGVTKAEYEALLCYNLPTYIARVDMNKKVIYIKGAFHKKDKYTSVYKHHKVSLADISGNKNVVNSIASEVKRYWEKGIKADYKESFQSKYDR